MVWELLANFSAFNIFPIPCMQNLDADLLDNVSSKLIPSESLHPNLFFMELIFRPCALDNITNWKVFDDDS